MTGHKIRWIAMLLAALLFVQGCKGTGEQAVEESMKSEIVQNESSLEETTQKAQIQESVTQEGNTETELGMSKADDSADGNRESGACGTAASEAEADQAGLPEGNTDGQDAETASDGSGGKAVSSLASPSSAGALHVEGTQLTGSNGEAVQLRGISTHGLAWYPDYVNEDCFRELRDSWQVNVIRLALYTAEYGGYCNGGNREELKRLIADGVEYAARADLYVIIDWHILSDSNPNTHKEEAKEFFAEMSSRYAGETHVLYEICNEPNGGTSWSEIKSYAEEIVGVIRENDDDAVILVGTPNWSQYVDQAAADPISGYENLMYTLHFYAATHKEELRERMRAAVDAGLPVFVSEYGICDASGNGGIDEEQANRWADEMDRMGISYVAWNLSNKDETSALIKSSCGKTSGFSEEDLSVSGQWLYRRLTGGAGELPASDEGGQDGSMEDKNPGSAGGSDDRPPETAAPAGTVLTDDSLEITAALVNSWEADGRPVYQYSVTICNRSDSRCSQWAVDLSFTEEITLSDGWNGDYRVDGTTLHITSKDYNGTLEPGASAADVGFIVSGGSLLP